MEVKLLAHHIAISILLLEKTHHTVHRITYKDTDKPMSTHLIAYNSPEHLQNASVVSTDITPEMEFVSKFRINALVITKKLESAMTVTQGSTLIRKQINVSQGILSVWKQTIRESVRNATRIMS